MELGLYMHIPFCIKKCPYCDFFSIEGKVDEELYLRAVQTEIELLSRDLSERFRPNSQRIITLYVGGGTPSLLSPGFYSKILDLLNRVFIFEPSELTLEANPETLRLDWLKAYRKLGFNRISLGVQSLSPRGLKFLERRHSINDIIRAVEMIKSADFENFSLDFIYGWPGQGSKSLLRELALALDFNPPHLSFYELTIYPGTKFYKKFRRNPLLQDRAERNGKLWILIDEFLRDRGYRHYEISNFAKDNFQCRHNLLYWTFKPYLGLGAGAVSRIGDLRFKNPEDLTLYYRALFEEKKLPFKIIEKFSKDEKIKEIIFMGLRTSDGISLGELQANFACVIRKEAINLLIERGLSELEGERLKLTRKGWLLHSEVVRFLWRNLEVKK